MVPGSASSHILRDMGESPGSVEDNEKFASRAVPTRALDGEEINNLFLFIYIL